MTANNKEAKMGPVKENCSLFRDIKWRVQQGRAVFSSCLYLKRIVYIVKILTDSNIVTYNTALSGYIAHKNSGVMIQ